MHYDEKDESINQKLEKGKKSSRKNTLIILALIALMILMVLGDFGSGITVTVLLGASIAMLFTLFHSKKSENKSKQQISSTVADGTLAEDFPGAQFNLNGKIPDSVLKADLGFKLYGVKSYGCSDLKGNYKGIDFETSSIIFGTTDSDGDFVACFKGPWFILHTGKNLPSDVIVSTRSIHSRKFQKKTSPIGDSDFDAVFAASSQDPSALDSLLTSQNMSQLLSLKNTAHGDIYLRFLADGTVYMAVNNNQDMFTIRQFDGNAENIRERFHQEAELLKAMIDHIITITK